MSKLDQHVGLVRFKLALTTFARMLALALTVWVIAVLLAIIVARLLAAHLPREMVWFWGSGGLAVVFAIGHAIYRWPSQRRAAVEIDQRLGLLEKFSTALYVRPSKDPFAAAAVRDAEQAAASVNLQKKFPVAYPKAANLFLMLLVVTLITYKWFPQMNLLAAEPAGAQKFEAHAITRPAAEQIARQALAEAEAAPREVMEDEHVKFALGEVQKNLDHPSSDPVQTQHKAEDLLKQISSIKQKIAETNKFVTETNEMNALKDISPPSPDEIGPISDAHRALADGKVDEAVEDLKKTVDNFDKMDKHEQQKAAEQMQKLAEQVRQKANDPKTQQEVESQLQQAGVDKDTAKQMSDAMKNAANGDQKAQQQLQQMANQAIQQANQQQGMSQQQQQNVANAIKQAMQSGQQKTNNQAGAQQMSQAAQQLAQAMKQASQQSAQQQANQKQGGQQGKQAQASGQKSGQQGQGQQAQAQQGQGQQGQQAGGQQSAQQMMQQQVAQLGAMAKDQQGVAAAQQGQQQGQGQQGQGQQGQGQQQGQQQGQGQQGQGQGQGQQVASGQWGQGQDGQGQQNGQNGQQNNQQGQGNQGQAGVGGQRPDPTIAPFGVKKEYSPSQTLDDGKIIASSFVKAPSERGESKIKMSQAIDAASKADAGEVDQDRIPRSAQKAVKDYFDTLKQDGK